MHFMYVGVTSPYDPLRHQEAFREYSEHPFVKCFEAEMNLWRKLRFELTEGDFGGNQNMANQDGPFTYNFRWLLKFDVPPYPEGIKLISGDLLEFYGHGNTCNSPEAPPKRWWQLWR